MGLLKRLFGKKRDKTTAKRQTAKIGSGGIEAGVTFEIITGHAYENIDVVYGKKKLENNLYAAVIKEYPPGTLKELMQGKMVRVNAPYPIEHVVEVGSDVNVKYKEVGAWPKPIIKK